MSFCKVETYEKINPLLFLKSWKIAVKECRMTEIETYQREDDSTISGYIFIEKKIELEVDYGSFKKTFGKQVFEQLKDAAGTLGVQLFVDYNYIDTSTFGRGIIPCPAGQGFLRGNVGFPFKLKDAAGTLGVQLFVD